MAAVGPTQNMGPRAVELFARVGVTTADGVRQLGAPVAYGLLCRR